MITDLFLKFFNILISIPREIFLWPIKLVYPIERVKKSIYIQPAIGQPPIDFHLSVSNATPRVRIALEIINASRIDIVFEKLILQNLILESEWIISSGSYMEREEIKQGEKKIITFFVDLNDLQVNKINEIKKEKFGKYGRFALDIRADFEAKLYGRFDITERLSYVFYE